MSFKAYPKWKLCTDKLYISVQHGYILVYVFFYYSLCHMNHIIIFLHHPIRIWFHLHSIVFWRHQASSPNWSLSIEAIRLISWLANIESISSFISFFFKRNKHLGEKWEMCNTWGFFRVKMSQINKLNMSNGWEGEGSTIFK